MASGSLTLRQIDRKTVEIVTDNCFGTGKSLQMVTATINLLLGRKVMTNLDSILKSRDIALPTKVCLVKAVVWFYSVVMHGCKSWTIRKLSTQELMLLNCGIGEDS